MIEYHSRPMMHDDDDRSGVIWNRLFILPLYKEAPSSSNAVSLTSKSYSRSQVSDIIFDTCVELYKV
jgi:hypothetical protein